MKKCIRCKKRYTDLWYKCIQCRSVLVTEQGMTFFKKSTREASGLGISGYLMEQLVGQANSLMIFTTPEGEALFCNDVTEFFTGYKKEELLRDDWLELLFRGQSARKEMFKAVMKGCLVSIWSKTYEGAIVRKDGSQCMLSWRLAAIRDEKENRLGILCVAHDVTDRKITEDDIDIHGQKFKDILSSIREYVLMTTNLEGKITYYGLGAQDVFGFSPDEVYLEDISFIYPKNNKTDIIKGISDALAKDGKFEGELELARKGDVEFPAVLTITPLLNRDGNTIGYTYMAKDMTERKEMQRQMIQSEKMAAVGQLASGIAHEINNPLLVIMGRLDLLDEQKMPPDLAKALSIVKIQAQRIRTLTDRLLYYAKDKKLDLKPIDINKMLQGIVPLLSYYPEFRKVSWREDFQEDLPLVRGDYNQLQEVFVNLGLNACQAMPDGGEIAIVTRYDDTHKKAYVLVKDTGIGMNSEQLKKLFDPFYTTKEKGTGLGLSICRNIIQNHKGAIGVESTHGKGTVFTVTLPVIN